MQKGNGKSQTQMISKHEAFIDLYERFYKVQRAAIFEYLKSKSRPKLDSSKELKIAE
jgi:hypothetical protein